MKDSEFKYEVVQITDLSPSCRGNKRYQKSNRAYPYIWTFRPESSRSSYCLISLESHISVRKFQLGACEDTNLANEDCNHKWKDFSPDAWKIFVYCSIRRKCFLINDHFKIKIF